jgi:hypothetical protein
MQSERGAKSVAVEVFSASLMASDVTAHTARCVGGDSWVVSWLPGRTLTGDQAATAMSIASTVGCHAFGNGAPELAVLGDWAQELGLTAREAAELVASRPGASQP